MRDNQKKESGVDALREAEQKYRDIFENAGEGIFQTTPEGRYIAANPALARMHGFDSPEELISSLRDISRQVYVDPARREEFKSLLEEHGVVRGFEHQLFRKDGSKIWVSVNARAVHDARGAIRYYEGTTQDINERKRAEARSAAFAALARKLSGAWTPLDAGRIIVQTAGDLFGWDSCDLNLYDADRDLIHHILSVDTIDGRQTDVTASISDRKPTARGRRIIDHGPELLLREEPVQFDEDAIPFGDESRPSASIMTVPIRHAARVVGLLSVQSYTPHNYDGAALDDLGALADHCGEALNRIRAEESLFESEERFRQMADHFEDVIWITDKDITKILYINPAHEKVSGRSSESLYERLDSFVEAVHPEDRARLERNFGNKRKGDHQPFEYRIVRPDGSVRWIQSRSFPIRNNDGEVYRVAGIAQDVTERKRAEEALRESEERYRDLVENSRELICTHDLDGLILSANRAAVEVLGYDPKDYCGRSIRDILAPEVRHQFDEYMARLCKDGATSGIMLVQTISGERRVWEYYNSLRTEGVAAPVVRGMARDITDQKRAEEALRASEKRFRTLIENSSDAIVLLDADGMIIDHAPRTGRVMGYANESLVGRDVLEMIHPEDRALVQRVLNELLTGEAQGITLQFRALHRNGSSRWGEGVAANHLGDPEVRAIVVNYRDITERKRAEEKVQSLARFPSENPNPVLRLGRDGMILHANSASRLLLQDWGCAVGDRAPLFWQQEASAALASQTNKTIDFVCGDITLSIFVAPIVEADYVNLYARDITERKRAEEALRQSEVYFRSLIEHATDTISTYDANGVRLYTSPSIERVLGYKPEEMIGRSGFELLHPDDRPFLSSLFAQAVQIPGTTVTKELRCQHKDGTWRTLESTGSNLLGNPEVGAVVLNSRDITERRRAEEALRESEERYRDLVENSQEFICTHDLDGLILSGNRAAVEVMGYDPKDYYKRNLRELLVPEVRDQFDDYLTRIRRDGVASGLMLVQTSSGERRVWEYHNTVRTEGVAAPIVRSMARDITERRRAEKAMSDLRRELEMTMNSMGEGVHRVDLKGNIVFENQAAARMLGWEVAELLGKHSHSTMHHTRQDGTPYPTEECPIYATFRDGVSRHVADEVFWRQDGTSFPVEYMTAPMRNDRNEIVAAVVTFRDITERKQIEAALRGKSEELDRYFNDSLDLLCIAGTDGYFRRLNPEWERTLGYSLAELEGRRFLDFVHPDDVAATLAAMRKLSSQEYVLNFINRYRHRDGSYRWIEWRSYPADDIIYAVARDITERKRAEEVLRLRESYLSAILENQPGLVWLKDVDSRFLTVNQAFADSCGKASPAELASKTDLDVWPKELAEKYRADDARIIKNQTSLIVEEPIFDRGKTTWFETFKTPILDDQGDVIGTTGYSRDITERKRAEEEKKITFHQLGERVKELGALHRAAQIFQDTQKTTSDVLQEIASILPAAWQYPDISAARVTYGGAESTTPNYSDTLWKQSAAFATKDGKQGAIEVVYLEGRPNEVEGPFLAEERNLINTLAYKLTVFLERKHAEKSLRESEERYRELFENAKDAIYVHDLGGRYTSVNHAAEKLSGFTREEILGKHFSNFVSPRDLKHVRINLCRKLDEENETIYEVDLVTRTGQRVPVEVSSRLIYESGVAVGIQGTARDITDRKRAQEALRIYSQRLIQVQEAERENIARELHDEIGQVLTAVKINLQSVQHTCQTADCVPRLNESIGIVDEALGRVRELSIELRPSLLDDLGLTAALRWYVDRYAQRTGIIAEVLSSFKEDGRLPRELETACFRIAQEALTNVARHARAGSVSVQLERSRERMLLTVMDDGVGFDIDKLRKSASAASALGLRGMEERALAVGGHIEIDSGLERGTRIRATFPLKRK